MLTFILVSANVTSWMSVHPWSSAFSNAYGFCFEIGSFQTDFSLLFAGWGNVPVASVNDNFLVLWVGKIKGKISSNLMFSVWSMLRNQSLKIFQGKAEVIKMSFGKHFSLLLNNSYQCIQKY